MMKSSLEAVPNELDTFQYTKFRTWVGLKSAGQAAVAVEKNLSADRPRKLRIGCGEMKEFGHTWLRLSPAVACGFRVSGEFDGVGGGERWS